jgi:hypothetical protein
MQNSVNNLTTFKYFIIKNEKINNEEKLEQNILKYLNNKRYKNIKIIKEQIKNKNVYFINVKLKDIPNVIEIINQSNNVEDSGVFNKRLFDKWLPWINESPYMYDFHSYMFDMVNHDMILDKILQGETMNEFDELVMINK